MSGREEAPGRRVHDQERLSGRELPRACLPVRRVDVSTSTLRYLSACLRTRRRAAGIQRPDALDGDRGYDHDKYRKQVREAGIKPVIARRGEQHDSGLGVPLGR